MNQVQPRQTTFEGVTIPYNAREPKKDLTPVELRIWKHLKRLGSKTEIEIRNHPSFNNILDVGRALRRLRSKKYVRSLKPRIGPQLWEAL